ncbi:MAG: hypothetical protein JSR33_08555 [Proteobacteria bacterium]|nr:hypothetical protein [Pseudomonadota bacterium]
MLSNLDQISVNFQKLGKLTITPIHQPLTHTWSKTATVVAGGILCAAIIFIIPTGGASFVGAAVAGLGMSL